MEHEPLVFSQSYESLRRLLGASLSEPLRERFKQHGVDFERLLPGYPLSTWLRSLELTLETLFPGVPENEATYQLGRRLFDSYSETLIGKALMAMLRVLGPRRGLLRIDRNLRTMNNYSATQLRELAPSHFELDVNLVRYPHYYRGVLESGLALAGAKQLTVCVLRHDQRATTFDLVWS